MTSQAFIFGAKFVVPPTIAGIADYFRTMQVESPAGRPGQR